MSDEPIEDEDNLCSDCLEDMDDTEFHCPDCGDHIEGDGTCPEGCNE